MKRNLIKILLITMVVFLTASNALAGTQSTFDFESQDVGLKLNAEGVGLYHLGAGTTGIVIDIGGDVSYAVLVWGGLQAGDCTASNCGDSEMVFSGTAITGVSIGKEHTGASNNHTAVGYGYDVTSLVQSDYSSPGSYTFSLADGNTSDNLEFLWGATLFVVFTDAGDATVSRVQLKFKTDYAYEGFLGPAALIDPIEFSIPPQASVGEGQYFIVSGEAVAARPDIIKIDGSEYCDLLASGDGDEWDTVVFTQTPSGTQTIVEIISGTGGCSDLTTNPDSLVVLGAGLSIAPTMDYGDLPDEAGKFEGYTLYETGASHQKGSLLLGADINVEFDGKPDEGADLDQYDDGIVPIGNWGDGTGLVQVTVTGDGCLYGWFDYNNDANSNDPDYSFGDIGEEIISGEMVYEANNPTILEFSLPENEIQGNYYARFRIFDAEYCDSANSLAVDLPPYQGPTVNGEVEDYFWTFGTNAVSMAGFSASAEGVPSIWVAVVALIFIAAITGLALVLRRQAAYVTDKS